jgi:hypothetical protein
LSQAQDDYGAAFREDTERWLLQLATEAETGNHEISADLSQWVDSILGSSSSSWGHSWHRLLKTRLGDRLRALLTFARRRSPPWELRTSVRRFSVLGIFTAEVLVHFEVDHVNKRVIFRQFLGLPGQAPSTLEQE